MMGWLAVVILIFGALSLISPAALQQGWPVGLAGLLVGGLAGLLVGEALGYGLARREQTRPSRARGPAPDPVDNLPSPAVEAAPEASPEPESPPLTLTPPAKPPS